MNYEQQINRIIETLKADKSIVQPWRNKATARLEESMAFVRMGRTTTGIKPPADMQPGRVEGSSGPYGCICERPGVAPFNPDCSIHGL